MKPITCKEVIQKEHEHLLLRRKKLGIEHGSEKKPNWFGIALSGGGIRSATFCLGVAQVPTPKLAPSQGLAAVSATVRVRGPCDFHEPKSVIVTV